LAFNLVGMNEFSLVDQKKFKEWIVISSIYFHVNKKFPPYYKRVEKLCKHFSWELLFKFEQNMKNLYS
jgi:hypothetical protein